MPSTGLLISFEGGEGGGKTTQIAQILKRLSKEGRKVIAVREPGGTAVGEQIREVVLSTKNTGNISFTTEVFLYQAARAQIYDEIVLPALKAGKIVLMDRTRDSSVVYQGIVRGFGKEIIDQLNDISTQHTYPNITFLLDVSVKTGLGRRAKTGEMNRLDLEAEEFHENVREAYLNLAKKDSSGRWIVVNAERPLEEVEEELWQKIKEKLDLPSKNGHSKASAAPETVRYN
jgi:dTMP kinase